MQEHLVRKLNKTTLVATDMGIVVLDILHMCSD